MILDCLFCKIIRKELDSFCIYENDYVYAFLDTFPNSDGHTLVVPKKHFEDLTSTDDFYLVEIAKAKKNIAILLETKLNAVGFNFVSNQKAIANQVIFHYHEHVIPKFVKEEGFLHNKNVKLKYEINEVFKKIKG